MSTLLRNSVLVATGLTATTFDPGRFQFSTTYYWRVDEVDQSGIVHPGSCLELHDGAIRVRHD